MWGCCLKQVELSPRLLEGGQRFGVAIDKRGGHRVGEDDLDGLGGVGRHRTGFDELREDGRTEHPDRLGLAYQRTECGDRLVRGRLRGRDDRCVLKHRPIDLLCRRQLGEDITRREQFGCLCLESVILRQQQLAKQRPSVPFRGAGDEPGGFQLADAPVDCRPRGGYRGHDIAFLTAGDIDGVQHRLSLNERR